MLWRGPHGELLVGRRDEVDALRLMTAEAAAGRGSAVFIEGEPGIGKSTAVAAGLAEADELGCRVLWGTADELSSRFPLRVLLDALTPSEKAEVTRPMAGTAADPVRATVEQLLALLGRLAATTPVVLVADDLQWADDTTLQVLRRLTRVVRGLPLLVVGAARPLPQGAELVRLRSEIERRISLEPLPDEQVDELSGALFETAGPEWRELAAQTGGNPLYVRELADSAARDAGRPQARLPGQLPHLPASLGAAIDTRLAALSREAGWTMRTAALLGVEFTIQELATVLDRAVEDVEGVVAEACTAALLVNAGDRLAWRHPLIRHALYEAMPWGMRAALHRHVAEKLSLAGASVDRVGVQVAAGVDDRLDPWLLGWITATGSALARRAPAVTVGLLRQAAEQLPVTDHRRADLEVRVAELLQTLGSEAELARHARAVLARTSDPVHSARMTWSLASALLRSGRAADAATELDRALAGPRAGQVLVSRLRSLRALTAVCLGHDGGPLAAQALAEAERSEDPFALALACYALSQQALAEGDSGASLRHLDRALTLPADGTEHVDLEFLLRCNRILLLTEVERLSQVIPQVRELLVLAEEAGTGRITDIQTVAAVTHFHAGDWDGAITALDAVFVHVTDPLPLRAHGVRALIAGYRGDDATLAKHLEVVADVAITRDAAYLVLARAFADVRAGRPEAALAGLTEALARPVDRLDLLAPAAVRIGLRLGRDVVGIRTGVAGRLCRGLTEADPEEVSGAAEYFRKADRPFDSAEAFEDLALVHARRGEREAAADALAEALAGYESLGAAWHVRRAAGYGITR